MMIGLDRFELPRPNPRESVHEAAGGEAGRIATTPAYKQSGHKRKKVKTLFAHLKRILKLDRLRLRGPTGARDEFLRQQPLEVRDDGGAVNDPICDAACAYD